MEKIFNVDSDESISRLDVYLADRTGRSRSFCQNLIKRGYVKLNGKRLLKASYQVKVSDKVVVEIPEKKPYSLMYEPADIPIIFENDYYLIINKPPGLVVHPGDGNLNHTLVHALLNKFDNSFKEHDIRPGIVHRLDKDTSGIMIVAKSENSRQMLIELFKSRKMKKIYHSLCIGNPPNDEWLIDANIGRDVKERKIMTVTENGKRSITFVKVIKRFDDIFLAEIKPLTGRTHQIRVHMKHCGFPIVGDKTYGNKKTKKFNIDRQALHAHSLEFFDPFYKIHRKFIADYTMDFMKLLNNYRIV
ncbi:MAG: RluA family pseudouridine synthase [Deferribacterota bacterium]|nr:RluA family pseudouridine synthase [Deferribacterota bacterium]